MALPTQVRILLPPLPVLRRDHADVAQPVEHLHGKEGVRGSSPRVGFNSPVKVAYVVLSYRNPAQVVRLVRALREGPAGVVFVRHDQRGSRLGAAEVRAAGGEPIEDDIELEWGGWSQLEAVLASLRRAAEIEPDWTVLLSGQDYPLRPMAEIEAGLADSSADGMLGAVREMDSRRPPGDDEFFLRAAYRHYPRPRGLPHLPRRLRPLVYVRDLPPRVGVRRLRRPRLRLYFSADWVTLGRRALRAVLAAGEDRALLRTFRRMPIPTESFFASVLLNDPRLTIERHHRRFILFAGPGVPHPATLTSADLEAALASGADFARKFDTGIDPHVLDRLDKRIRDSSFDRLDSS
jgi:Core-2/I-Branching enzyme